MDFSFCHCDWSHSEIYLITVQVIEGFPYTTGFPGGLVAKNPPANAGNGGDMGSIPGSGRSPWRKKWQLTPVFLPGENPMGGGAWQATVHGVAESDMT